jgi:hypothetical protein
MIPAEHALDIAKVLCVEYAGGQFDGVHTLKAVKILRNLCGMGIKDAYDTALVAIDLVQRERGLKRSRESQQVG